VHRRHTDAVEQRLVGCPAWRIDDQLTYCLDGQVYTVGAVVTWLISMGSCPSRPTSIGSAPRSTTRGRDVRAGSSPDCARHIGNPSARRVHRSDHVDRARPPRPSAIEGIAAQVALLAHAAGRDLGSPLTRLRVDGGLTRSNLCCKHRPTFYKRRSRSTPSPHATALGVAAFADLGAGETSLDQAGSQARRPDVVIEPEIGADEAEERLRAWQRVASATMDL
jgi:glycerol kinase